MTKMRPRKPPNRAHKAKRRGNASKRGEREPLPNLHAILGVLSDATAFVSVALDCIRYGGDYGP